MATNNAQVNIGMRLTNASQTVRQINQVIRPQVLPLKIDTDPRSLSKIQRPLGQITGSVAELDKSLEASNARIVAFAASAALISSVSKSFQAVFQSVREVELSLIKISSITGQSLGEVKSFGNQLFDVAKQTGQSFETAATAALELSRQGLKAEETMSRLKSALILTRIEGISAESAVEGLTAVINGFSETNIEAIDIVNKFNAVANNFALSNKDLIESFKRSASVAQNASLSLEQLAAVTASVQQQTARGGAVIGNAYKTIFTRLNNTSTLNAIESIGVQTRDLNGDLRNSIDILKDVGTATESLSSVARTNIFEKIAGKRQIALLIPLIKDLNREFGVYEGALDKATNATDEAERKNDLYNTTIDASVQRIKTLGVELANLTGASFDDDFRDGLNFIENSIQNIKSILSSDIGQGFLKGISTFISGPGVLIAGAAIAKLFSQFSKFAADAIVGISGFNKKSKDLQITQSLIQDILAKNNQSVKGFVSSQGGAEAATKELLKALRSQNRELLISKELSEEIAANINASPQGKKIFKERRKVVPNKASGVLGAFEKEFKDIKRGVGGASGSASPVLIDDFNFGGSKGPLVANTSEYIIRDPRGDSIITKDMLKDMPTSSLSGAKPIVNASKGIPTTKTPTTKSLGQQLGLNSTDFEKLKDRIKNISKNSSETSDSFNKLNSEVKDSKSGVSDLKKALQKVTSSHDKNAKAVNKSTKAAARHTSINEALASKTKNKEIFIDSNNDNRFVRGKNNLPDIENDQDRFSLSPRMSNKAHERAANKRKVSLLDRAKGRFKNSKLNSPFGAAGLFVAGTAISGSLQNQALGQNEAGETNSRFEASESQRFKSNMIGDISSFAGTGALLAGAPGAAVGALAGFTKAALTSSLSLKEFAKVNTEYVNETSKKLSELQSALSDSISLEEDHKDSIYTSVEVFESMNSTIQSLSGVVRDDFISSLKQARGSLSDFNNELKGVVIKEQAAFEVDKLVGDLINNVAFGEKMDSSKVIAQIGASINPFVSGKEVNTAIGGRTATNLASNEFNDLIKTSKKRFSDFFANASPKKQEAILNELLRVEGILKKVRSKYDTAEQAYAALVPEVGEVRAKALSELKSTTRDMEPLINDGVGEIISTFIRVASKTASVKDISKTESLTDNLNNSFESLSKAIPDRVNADNDPSGKVEKLRSDLESRLNSSKAFLEKRVTQLSAIPRSLADGDSNKINPLFEAERERFLKDQSDAIEDLSSSIKVLSIAVRSRGTFTKEEEVRGFRKLLQKPRNVEFRENLAVGERSDARLSKFKTSVNSSGSNFLDSLQKTPQTTKLIEKLEENSRILSFRTSNYSNVRTASDRLQNFTTDNPNELFDLQGIPNIKNIFAGFETGVSKLSELDETIKEIELVLRGVDKQGINNKATKDLIDLLKKLKLDREGVQTGREDFERKSLLALLNNTFKSKSEEIKKEIELSNTFLKARSEVELAKERGSLDRFTQAQNFKLNDPREFVDLSISGEARKRQGIRDSITKKEAELQRKELVDRARLQIADILESKKNTQALSKLTEKVLQLIKRLGGDNQYSEINNSETAVFLDNAKSLLDEAKKGVKNLFEESSVKDSGFDLNSVKTSITKYLKGGITLDLPSLSFEDALKDKNSKIIDLLNKERDEISKQIADPKLQKDVEDLFNNVLTKGLKGSLEEFKISVKNSDLNGSETQKLISLAASSLGGLERINQSEKTKINASSLTSLEDREVAIRDFFKSLRESQRNLELSQLNPRASNFDKVSAANEADRLQRVRETGKPAFLSFSQSADESFAVFQDNLNSFEEQMGRQVPNLFASNMSNAFSEISRGVVSFEDGMIGAIKNISDSLNQSFAENITNHIMSSFNSDVRSGSGSGGGIGGFFSNLFSGFQKKNSGGMITGGSGVRDDVPALLTGGEYVLKKSAVDKLGVNTLNQMNQGAVPAFNSGGSFMGSLLGYGVTGIASTLLNNRSVRARNREQDRGLSERMQTAGSRQGGGDLFIPGSTTPDGRFNGYIQGKEDMLRLANQNTTSGSRDRISGGGKGFSLALEDQSQRLSGLAQLGLIDGTNIASEVKSTKAEAFGMYVDQEKREQAARKEAKNKRRGLLTSIFGTALGFAASSFLDSKTSGKSFLDTIQGKGGDDNLIKKPARSNQNDKFNNSGINSVDATQNLRETNKARREDRVRFAPIPTFSPRGQGSASASLLPRLDGSLEDFGGIFSQPPNFNAGGNAMVQGGEFIMQPQTVKNFGKGAMSAMNSGGIPSFNAGGSNSSSSGSSMMMGSEKVVEKLDILIDEMKSKSNGNITINIEKNGDSSSQASDEQDKNLALKIESKVREVINLEQRIGGTLRRS